MNGSIKIVTCNLQLTRDEAFPTGFGFVLDLLQWYVEEGAYPFPDYNSEDVNIGP